MNQRLVMVVLIILAVSTVVTALYVAERQSPPKTESLKCQANAAEIGLTVEDAMLMQEFVDAFPDAIPAIYEDVLHARLLIARRIELDCMVNLRPCDDELRALALLQVSAQKAELTACQELLDVQRIETSPPPQQGGIPTDG